MADFEHIQSIQTVANENDLKGLLKLKIAGATEPLTISCPSLSAAEDMAGLIDGYCKLVNSGKESCWNRKGIEYLNDQTSYCVWNMCAVKCFEKSVCKMNCEVTISSNLQKLK